MKKINVLELFAGSRSIGRAGGGALIYNIFVGRLSFRGDWLRRGYFGIWLYKSAFYPGRALGVSTVYRFFRGRYRPKLDKGLAHTKNRNGRSLIETITENSRDDWLLQRKKSEPRLVYRKSEGHDEENAMYAKSPTSYGYVLSVRRYTDETDGYMDEQYHLEASSGVQKRRYVPRSSSSRIEYRDARFERSVREIQNTGGPLFRNFIIV